MKFSIIVTVYNAERKGLFLCQETIEKSFQTALNHSSRTAWGGENNCFYYESECDISREDIYSATTRIYKKIEEVTSKELFTNRLMYSLTSSCDFLANIIAYNQSWKHDIQFIDNCKATYIYGAGVRGSRIPLLFPSKNYTAYIDKNKSGKLNGLDILSLDDFTKINKNDIHVIVSNEFDTDEIIEYLGRCSVLENQIQTYMHWIKNACKNIYFDSGILRDIIPSSVDGFVDVGAFDGDTTIEFLKWTGNKRATAYVFEPERKNYDLCVARLEQYENVEILNCAASDKISEAYISSNGRESRIEKSQENLDRDLQMIKSVKLDDVLKDKKVGFIKMDVEGYELKALKGAVKTIRRCHPILAISVYHKREDIWQVPEFVLDICENYELRFGHYTLGKADTVMYAIPR